MPIEQRTARLRSQRSGGTPDIRRQQIRRRRSSRGCRVVIVTS